MPIGKLAMGSAGGAVAVVVFLCVLAPAAGETQKRSDSAEEHLLFNCRLDLLGINFVQASMREDFIGDSSEINQEIELLEEDDMQKAIALRPSHMKHALLDCLGKQNFPSSASGEEDRPKTWYSEHLENLLGWHATSRRQLAVKPSQTEVPGSVPAPSPSPALASVPIPSPVVDPPSHAAASPAFAPVASPSDNSAADSPSPKQITSPLADGEGSRAPSQETPILPPRNNNSNNRKMIVVIVVTATTSVLFTALLFYCYNRCCRNRVDIGVSHRDDRPLLTLSSSDFSVGSSQKSFGLSNSVHTEKISTLSLKNELNYIGRVPSLSSHGEQIVSFDTKAADPPTSGIVSAVSSFSIGPSASTATPSVTPIVAPAPRSPPPPPVMPPPMRISVPPPPVMPPPMKMSAPPPPNPPLNVKPGPRPPPPPKGAFAPRPPQASSSSGRVPSPLGLKQLGKHHSDHETINDAPKTKLKPFFWDKVLANPDQSMVWHQISSGSFQFSEEMIENLFGYADKQKTAEKKSAANEPSPQFIQILDPKKSQNLAILLRALNVTMEEVYDALMEGNELPRELLQTLLKMSPSTDEELKLRLYAGEISHLGPAERFLKALVDIPFAFKRFDALLYMTSLEEDTSNIKKDLATIEGACQELRSSRLFKKLLEAVIKIGNRMNDGTYRGGAQAFKLDTLLKLADVKGADGKTTLLHFIVQEIIRSEGMRAEREATGRGTSSLTTISSLNLDDYVDESSLEYGDHYCNLGLKVVSGLPSELEHVKNAAFLDADALTSMVGNLGKGLVRTKEFLDKDMRNMEEDSGFHRSLKGFIERAEFDVKLLLQEERRIRLLVKSTTDFFHGNAAKDEGLRLFVIVRDFLGMLDKTCEQVSNAQRRAPKTPANKDASKVPSLQGSRQLLFPSVRERQLDSSSSDDGSP